MLCRSRSARRELLVASGCCCGRKAVTVFFAALPLRRNHFRRFFHLKTQLLFSRLAIDRCTTAPESTFSALRSPRTGRRSQGRPVKLMLAGDEEFTDEAYRQVLLSCGVIDFARIPRFAEVRRNRVSAGQ